MSFLPAAAYAVGMAALIEWRTVQGYKFGFVRGPSDSDAMLWWVGTIGFILLGFCK